MRKSFKELESLSKQIRRCIIETIANAQKGHLGGALSSVDILTPVSKDISFFEMAIFLCFEYKVSKTIFSSLLIINSLNFSDKLIIKYIYLYLNN